MLVAVDLVVAMALGSVVAVAVTVVVVVVVVHLLTTTLHCEVHEHLLIYREKMSKLLENYIASIKTIAT